MRTTSYVIVKKNISINFVERGGKGVFLFGGVRGEKILIYCCDPAYPYTAAVILHIGTLLL